MLSNIFFQNSIFTLTVKNPVLWNIKQAHQVVVFGICPGNGKVKTNSIYIKWEKARDAYICYVDYHNFAKYSLW